MPQGTFIMAIQTLAPEVAAKIAAGEVVERPASVVKELVENSLDAGASAIQVVIQGGGVPFIQVVDNGVGIPSDEVELAFQRHATSKLLSLDDLERIQTLGFRGEALPSIAAVARVTLLTRTSQEQAGTLVEVRDGAVQRRQRRAAPVGTTVTVRQLFGQVPARRKFLRTAAAEMSRIQDVLSHLALAYPEVRFTLKVDGRTPLISPGTGKLHDALAAVYRIEVAQQMLALTSSAEGVGVSVEGYVSPPELSRGNGTAIVIIINRRWVQNRPLTFAIREAYRGFLAERRYPLAVLLLEIPAQEMDVNVHPAKTEVRLRREREVFGVVQRAVREVLVAQAPVPTVPVGLRATSHIGAPAWAPAISSDATERALRLIPRLEEAEAAGSGEASPFRATLPLLRVLGQLQTTYIIAEGPDGMYLIDQHAAHERVLYEGLQQAPDSPLRQRQGLLEPAMVELTPEEEEMLGEVALLLETYGFLLEPFGSGGWLVRATPSALKDADPGRALRDVLGQLRHGRMNGGLAEQVSASVACHGSVRAGQVLHLDEMRELVRQLERASQPQTCPHGRPTVIRLSTSHLERQFGRR